MSSQLIMVAYIETTNTQIQRSAFLSISDSSAHMSFRAIFKKKKSEISRIKQWCCEHKVVGELSHNIWEKSYYHKHKV